MGNSISSFITKLVPLINKEREGLLFIDGRWGSGKTYFIHNRLKSYYSDLPIFYISLLGITSLADFKSKIIECYYLEGAENLANDFNSLADGVSLLRGKPDESGVLRSFFSSIGTSVKGKVLSNLSGLFILDDIERMNDNELTSNILNYCHSLYFQRENRSLDFIVVGNTTKEANFEIKHKEKIISDTISFELNHQDLSDIIKPNLISFPDDDKKLFLKIIERQELSNLRIINRCINKIEPLFKYINSNPDKIWTVRSEDIIECITSSIILQFQFKKSIDELKEKNPENYLFTIDDDATYAEKNLWDSYRKYAVPNVVREYSMGLESVMTVQDYIFSEPKKITIDYIATADRPHIFDIDETSLQQYLLEVITRNKKVTVSTWLLVVNNYLFLTKNEYLAVSPSITHSFIEQKANEFSIDDISIFIDEKGGIDNLRRYGTSSLYGNPYISLFIKKYELYDTNEKINTLRNIIEKDGWYHVNVSDHIDNIDHNSKYKPLEIIGTSFLAKHILTTWKPIDIESFESYLQNLYNFNNIKDFLSGEKFHLMKLEMLTSIYLSSHRPSLKFGALKSLNHKLNEILSRL
ncbi:P-loop NTPase fold protein [Citrobacter freundii]|uniref:P-loop NTPase fold protein n=1 Tax=Citrobacter TaxID=544 RepID=UPI002574C1D8|nr:MULTISPECIES: P-loop NTPase fold protein [Citrobacter]MDM3088964.1 hypothetical protein [Citrobacter sp. Cf133]MDT7441906.1 hypothetical protein [Citrobacter freundii]MDT9380724.1 hypothetical protein [Citrobacter freundii]HDX5106927.1 hypothetical protein [Citrobacter freundii]